MTSGLFPSYILFTWKISFNLFVHLWFLLFLITLNAILIFVFVYDVKVWKESTYQLTVEANNLNDWREILIIALTREKAYNTV